MAERESGLRWLLDLRADSPDLKVIVVCVHHEPSVERAVRAAGADAFVLERAIATDLLSAAEAVLAGRPFP